MRKTRGNWIDKAVKRPGALRKKAKRAGKTAHAYAEAHKHSPGRTGRQARLALTLGKMRRSKKRSKRRTKR